MQLRRKRPPFRHIEKERVLNDVVQPTFAVGFCTVSCRENDCVRRGGCAHGLAPSNAARLSVVATSTPTRSPTLTFDTDQPLLNLNPPLSMSVINIVELLLTADYMILLQTI